MDIVLRASVMFALLYLLIRLMGKRELAQMTPFEIVVLVVMGDLIQQGVTHNDFSLTGAALAIGTFAFWGFCLSWAAHRCPRSRIFWKAVRAFWWRTAVCCTKISGAIV
ncbi:DUF421 domain-containing protein [Sphingopyxis terrae]|uniref:DUF421 domain-containing protein n=1 Tax=Sphingopyxis terrae TaxID=33052 RepID=UPI0036120BD4